MITDRKIAKHKCNPDKKGRVYEQNRKYYKYKCNKCGFDCGEHYKNGEYKEELWAEEFHLIEGNGCSCCVGKVVVKNINDLWTTNSLLAQQLVNPNEGYKITRNHSKKILLKCPICGFEKECILNGVKDTGISCPVCSDGISYGEKFTCNLLKQLGLKFNREYSPNYFKGRRSDFYIPDRNLIIEIDGTLHSKLNTMNNQTAYESKEIDCWKDKQHELHGLKTIRILYDDKNHRFELEDLKCNFMQSELSNIFDLSNINWDKCHLDGLTNKLKEICDYRAKYNNVTSYELANIFNLSSVTILRYLNIGASIGLCNYNGEEEASRLISEKNGIKVSIYKDDILLGIFRSRRELNRQSEILFGIKLSCYSISQAIKNNKQYKGFTFK